MRLAVSGDNLCLLCDYLCLRYPENTSCFCRGVPVPASFFYLCKKFRLKDTNRSLKIPCMFDTWMEFVRQILIEFETYFISGFRQSPLWCHLGSNVCKYADGHSVTTEVRTSFAAACAVWRSGSSLELSALCNWRQCLVEWQPNGHQSKTV